VEPDFWLGAGVLDFEGDVEVLGVLGCLLVAPVVVVLCVVGDAAAPAMPATAPPVASAPATIVAPSILEMVIGRTSWGRWWGSVVHRGRRR
jgi:hypothetical protein